MPPEHMELRARFEIKTGFSGWLWLAGSLFPGGFLNDDAAAAVLLGTALPGFRSCKPPWLRLSQRPWDHKPLGDKAYHPGRGAISAHFISPCLALSLTS